MNTNPKAKRILCFGDSNTHGRDPQKKAEDGVKTRFPVGVRWTTQLQELLGSDFEVIEEGQGGRTTNIDDPQTPGRNGLTYLIPCLESHIPLDVVVLMLGTNDFKDRFNRSPADVAQANKQLISVISEIVPEAKILLVAPILINGQHPMAKDNYSIAAEKSELLGTELKKVAEETGVLFFDLAPHVQPSIYDGLHIDKEDQATVAKYIFKKVTEAYN